MTRSAPLPGGDLEYAVLSALWEMGQASAPEIHEQVGVPRSLVYTTTARVLDRLFAKKLVAREKAGKSFVYRPRAKRETIDRARAKLTIGRLLGVKPKPVMATLVDAVESIDPDLLDELARAVAARKRSRRGP